jgi:DNA-binding transcriptional LysR family regulator
MDISVRQVRAAALVAETLSYVRAAEQLGYTEPAVHHQIRKLQEALGCALFEKRGRGLGLTKQGAKLMPHLLSILSDVDVLEASAHDQDKDLSHRVPVAAGIVTGAYILPRVVSLFGKVDPETAIEMQFGRAEEVAQAVERGRASIGICTRLSRVALTSTINLVPWMQISFGLFSSAETRRPLATPIIIFTVGTVTEPLTRLLKTLELLGLGSAEVRFLSSADAVKNVCQAGLGLGFLPTSAARVELDSGALVRVDSRMPDITDTIWLCHGPESSLSQPAKAFLAFLQGAAETLAEPDLN